MTVVYLPLILVTTRIIIVMKITNPNKALKFLIMHMKAIGISISNGKILNSKYSRSIPIDWTPRSMMPNTDPVFLDRCHLKLRLCKWVNRAIFIFAFVLYETLFHKYLLRRWIPLCPCKSFMPNEIKIKSKQNFCLVRFSTISLS